MRIFIFTFSIRNDIANYYYITLSEFFTLVLIGGFSQKSEWQQVSSDLQDSSKYFS